MDATALYAHATRFAAAQGRTTVVPFPADAYQSDKFNAHFAAHPVPATFTFDADGQCVVIIRAEDRPALDRLLAAVA